MRIRFWLFFLGLLAVLFGGYLLYNQLAAKIVWKGKEKKEITFQYFSQLDGAGVASSSEQTPDIVGVMIDNHPEGQPQFGLTEASVVYEAPAEGGITRFLAIFPRTSTLAKVGPVRSARDYYLDWLREYGDALYLHCGGSPAALDLIKQENIFDANEFFNGQYYWRDSAYHEAPHNLFTNGELWQKIFNHYAGARQNFFWTGWKFGSLPASTSVEMVKEITLKYFVDYKVSWKFNAAVGRYERWVNDQKFTTAEGEGVYADNVLVQLIRMEVIDEVGRRAITTIGQGGGRVLRGGVMLRGTWKKQNPTDRTRFFDASGAEIPLTPGQSWVEVVPNNTVIEVTN